jgi:hypothetical protein
MQSKMLSRRFRPAIAAVTATLLSTTGITTAVAESESPFGDAVRVADGALDNMRGGFAGSDGSMVRFGVNLETSVNGHPIASVSISNDANGKIHASAQNLGRTFVLQADGSVQVKTTIPAAANTPSTVTTQQNATSSVSVTTLPTTVTMPLGSPVTANTTQQSSSSSVTITTTLVPTLPSSVSSGATLATTGLLPNGNGVMTLIQNTQSNVVIHALNTLNIQISGIGSPAARNSTALRNLTSSMRFSVRR